MKRALFTFHLIEARLQILQVIGQAFRAAVELGSKVQFWCLSTFVVDQNVWKLSIELSGDEVFLNKVDSGHDAEAEEAADHCCQENERNQNPL